MATPEDLKNDEEYNDIIEVKRPNRNHDNNSNNNNNNNNT
jgi:hypothetical protein